MKKLVYCHILLLSVLFLCLTSSSCKRGREPEVVPSTDPQINLNFKANASGSDFTMNKVGKNASGQNYFLSLLLFYCGNPRLVKTDGSEVALKDILLVSFDMTKDPTHDPLLVGTSFSLSTSAGSFKAIRFGVGVPKALDGVSQSGKYPTQYPTGHPLAYNRNTYWDWPGGGGIYRFAMIEGQIYTSDTTVLSYHTGFDSLYREVEIAHTFSIEKGSSHDITISLDVNKIFSDMDMTKEYTTHMGDGNVKEGIIGKKIMDNLSKAMSIQ